MVRIRAVGTRYQSDKTGHGPRPLIDPLSRTRRSPLRHASSSLKSTPESHPYREAQPLSYTPGRTSPMCAAEAATAMLEARGGADGVRLLEPPLVLRGVGDAAAVARGNHGRVPVP